MTRRAERRRRNAIVAALAKHGPAYPTDLAQRTRHRTDDDLFDDLDLLEINGDVVSERIPQPTGPARWLYRLPTDGERARTDADVPGSARP